MILRQTMFRAVLWLIIAIVPVIYTVRDNSHLVIAFTLLCLAWLLTKLFIVKRG